MPYFDDFYAAKLRGGHGLEEADEIVDLRGVTLEGAQAIVREIIEFKRVKAVSIAFRIDGAAPGGGETLFQPLGRTLLAARRKGAVQRLEILPAQDGQGFFVVIGGQKQSQESA